MSNISQTNIVFRVTTSVIVPTRSSFTSPPMLGKLSQQPRHTSCSDARARTLPLYSRIPGGGWGGAVVGGGEGGGGGVVVGSGGGGGGAGVGGAVVGPEVVHFSTVLAI